MELPSPNDDSLFENQTVIGRSRLTQKFSETPASKKNYYETKDRYFLAFEKKFPADAAKLIENATSREVRPYKESVDAAMKKKDTLLKTVDPNDKKFLLAMEFATRHLFPLLQQPVVLDKVVEFNGASSAGLTGKQTGFPKTVDYLQSTAFDELREKVDYIPIELVNTKDEFLSLQDDLVARNKIRLVNCCEKHEIYKQKILYDNQSRAFQAQCSNYFIKYGFTKQYGGFNRLIMEFEPYEKISLSDVSGYDTDALLSIVYSIKNKYLMFPVNNGQYWLDIMSHVTYYACNPVRLYPNGEITQSDHSNSSGQGCTTIDNSILHEVIIWYEAISLYLAVEGDYPLYEECRDIFNAAIYSDDKILGFKGKYAHHFTDEEFSEFEIGIYKDFGMTIKKSASKVFTHVSNTVFTEEDGMEFLGSTAVWDHRREIYIPKPRLGKLCSSLVYKLVHHDDADLELDQQFSKVIQIHSLMRACPEEITAPVISFLNFLENSAGEGERYILQDIRKSFNYDKDYTEWYTVTGNECAQGIGRLAGGFNSNMQKVSRAEQLLNKLQARTGMSEDGKNWLIAAIDPFHDDTIRLAGFPDMTTGNSIVQCVKLTTTVNPSTVTYPNGVDMIIRTDNFAFATGMANATLTNGTLGTLGQPVIAGYGGCQIYYNAVGSDLSNSSLANYTGLNLTLPVNYFQGGRSRVIAVGVEAHNLTPPLTIGGAVNVFEQPQSNIASNYPIANLTVALGSADLVPYQAIPSSEAYAMLLHGTQSWEAKYGAYIVPTMQSMVNPVEYPDTIGMIETTSMANRNASLCSAFPASQSAVFRATTLSGSVQGLQYMNNLVPFNSKGIYFTGLPSGSVIKINYNVYVERFPDERSGDLTVLATPCANYDPVALEAYARIMKMMPVGVKVKENGFGDWFAGNVASLIDHLTGSKFSSDFLSWADSKVVPAQTNVSQASTFNAPSRVKQQNPKKIGPRAPNGKFLSQEAKVKKAKKQQKIVAKAGKK